MEGLGLASSGADRRYRSSLPLVRVPQPHAASADGGIKVVTVESKGLFPSCGWVGSYDGACKQGAEWACALGLTNLVRRERFENQNGAVIELRSVVRPRRLFTHTASRYQE